MDTFSMRGAWSFGWRFFADRRTLQILVLIGLGLVVPALLQLALAGTITNLSSPAAMRANGAMTGVAPAAGVATGIALLLTYFLQLASYFTAWRLGFAWNRPASEALLFGLLATLLAFAVFALIGGPALFAAGAAMSSGIPFLGLLIGLIPLAIVFAIFYTLPAAVLATIASIVLVLAMLFGAATGNVGMAATLMGGGSGAVVVFFLLMSVALMWLATRFSCTTSVMADRKSCNLVAAMRESWRLTLEDQWVILRYLALIAFGLAVLVLAVSIVAGLGAVALLEGGGGTAGRIGALVLGLALGVPVAFLTVLLPAGIYRELTRSSLDAEIFA